MEMFAKIQLGVVEGVAMSLNASLCRDFDVWIYVD